MKTITISTLALLFVSITAFAGGGCVMDPGEQEEADEETSEVEQGLINWPGGKSPQRACSDTCNEIYNECRLENGEGGQCSDDWNECRRMCMVIFGPISKY
jgi:hypothetical protein